MYFAWGFMLEKIFSRKLFASSLKALSMCMLLCALPIHTVWLDWFAISSAHTLFKGGISCMVGYLFKNKIVEQAKKELRQEFADLACKSIQEEQHNKLVQNIESEGKINSNYFTEDVSGDFFNHSEVKFLLRRLNEEKENFNLDDASENKKIKVIDIRELPEKGGVDGLPNVNKFAISFEGKLSPTGQKILKSTFLERILGEKTKIERTTNQHIKVQVIKNLVKTIITGVENNEGLFEWEKINGTSFLQADEEQTHQKAKKKGHKVGFDETKNKKIEITDDKWMEHKTYAQQNPTIPFLRIQNSINELD